MPAYAVAHLHRVDMGPDIAAYLERIEATLAPYGGRFLVHGGNAEVLEGPWTGHLVVIAFPDREQARAWYHSDAYQAILPLRTNNAEGETIIVDGVSENYRAADMLAK